MKLNNTLITTAIFSVMTFSVFAAQELTPEKADQVVPFERITFSGRYDNIYEANQAASKRADKAGATSFFVRNINDQNSEGGNSRVVVDLYHADAKPVSNKTQYRIFNGVRELPKPEASLLEPFDTVTIRGLYPVQDDINQAISKLAKDKGAYSFFIVRQIEANGGANQLITAYIYKKDAAHRNIQAQDNPIPADSEAGKSALVASGVAAADVEVPNVSSSTSFSDKVGRFFETQTSTEGSRYTITLRDGTKIQELNNATADKMTPFDSVTFTDNFSSTTDMSEQIANRAAKKGAKYYQITRQWEKKGGTITVTADLYK